MKFAFALVAVLLLNAADWQATFAVDKKNLGTKGSNPYFNLTPGYQLSYKNGNETDTLTVLNETKLIDGVETRPIEDRELKNGQVIEVTRDYYAIDSATDDVYYFGEEVDVYKNGEVASHEGTWLSGEKGAKFGLMMPAKPKAGQRFYQEQGARGRHGPRGNCLRPGEDRDAGRGIRKLRSYSRDQSAGKGVVGSQVVRGGRGAGEGREDAAGEVRNEMRGDGAGCE